jgi:enoyl-CoA hydratase/carnithine racemase
VIRTSLHDRILHLTLARAEKKNALNSAMYEALTRALIDAEGNSGVHAVLFDAEGDTFTAGNDLSDFAAVASGALNPSELQAVKFLDVLTRGTKPYVAAVQGAAVGIGTTLLLHCDLVYVAEDARLSTPFANLALVPEAGSSVLLPARIGHVRAFAMFALGESIDGRTAASLGLANEAVPASEVRSRALAAAKALASKPMGALQETKKLMRDADAIRAIMAREVEVFRERLTSAEALAAFQAFVRRKDVM